MCCLPLHCQLPVTFCNMDKLKKTVFFFFFFFFFLMRGCREGTGLSVVIRTPTNLIMLPQNSPFYLPFYFIMGNEPASGFRFLWDHLAFIKTNFNPPDPGGIEFKKSPPFINTGKIHDFLKQLQPAHFLRCRNPFTGNLVRLQQNF